MKKFEDLLLDTIRNDIDYLFQEVYLPRARSSRKYLGDKYFAKRFDDVIHKSKYSLNDISIMCGVNANESYMLDLIKIFCDDNFLFSSYSDIDRINLIPMFKYFIDKDINNARLMGSFFLPIHCSGQMTNVFFDDKASTKPLFKVNYTLISGIEHSLGSKDLRFNLGSAIYYLNFINYEKRNALTHNDSEYFNKLSTIGLELEKFLSFYGSDDLLIKYNTGKNDLVPSEINYSDHELAMSLDNLNLLKHFYDGVFPNYSNKIYELGEIEECIVNSANKKKLLLASFCYRKYCDDDFFRSFDDVELDVDDVYDFILECEKADLKVTDRQITNLLSSFKEYYLTKSDLVDDYKNEKKCILEAYYRYCARNWAFEKNDFINFFNSLYGKEFKTFGFSNNVSLLTPEILDEVIGNNKFVGYEKIKKTNIGSSYFSRRPQTDKEEYYHDIEYRKQIFKKYYDFASEYCDDPHVTIHYFIHSMGVSLEDEKMVEELIDWCFINSDSNSDFYSEELRKNTDEEIRRGFKEDLLTNFRDCEKVLNKYISIIDRDNIAKYGTVPAVKKIYSATKKEQLSKLADAVVKRANIAIESGLVGWDIFNDINLSKKDIRLILNRNGVNWRKFDESKNIRLEFCSQIFKNTMQAAKDYITSDLSIKDICNKYGCLPESIRDCVATYMKTDSELFEKFHNKVIENNECLDNSYIDVDSIVYGITNGFVMPDGKTRKYTLFDLIMSIGHNVNLYEIRKFLDKSYPNNYFVSNFFYINPPFSSIYSSYDLRKVEPFSRQIRKEMAVVNINGEQHMVTDEERETVLGFLEKRDLPSCLYYDAVRAYLNGEFNPNEKATNKKMIKISDKKSEN